ncbi:MAG: PSP1 domain-containing protein [Anaerolineae bacterium]
MPLVCGVRFRGAGKVYHFGTADLPIETGDYVIVSTARGDELGQVSEEPHDVTGAQVVGELKPVLRKASAADLSRAEQYRQKETEAVGVCQEQIVQVGLQMKVVSAEYSYDGSRLTFYFTSEDRVDFRALVRDLARTFKARIDLRQIGVRDEAKLVGGLGPCGRPLCCATWLTQFSPVSIRMAKQQNLPLSPMEISGLCGRLLCCLTYENDFYHEVRASLPKAGRMVDTPYGSARVLKVSVLRETVNLLLEDGSTVEMTADQISGAEPMAPRNEGVESAVLTDSLRRAAGPAPRDQYRGTPPGARRPTAQDQRQSTGRGSSDESAGRPAGRGGAPDARRPSGPQDSARLGVPMQQRPGGSGDGTKAADEGTSTPENTRRRPRGGRSGRRRRGPRGPAPANPAQAG